ncbi:hypothetical protein NDU88_007873 [Pleurodeles waltl]|uniref:Uncharacterized protein n=1 Tax=Pleurodeles waltl TaxID=8319 RepID=A0AAV7U111_PLEWA|nr:hypothetical protein NDU88_007873 [Pleurodeles waltl]
MVVPARGLLSICLVVPARGLLSICLVVPARGLLSMVVPARAAVVHVHGGTMYMVVPVRTAVVHMLGGTCTRAVVHVHGGTMYMVVPVRAAVVHVHGGTLMRVYCPTTWYQHGGLLTAFRCIYIYIHGLYIPYHPWPQSLHAPVLGYCAYTWRPPWHTQLEKYLQISDGGDADGLCRGPAERSIMCDMDHTRTTPGAAHIGVTMETRRPARHWRTDRVGWGRERGRGRGTEAETPSCTAEELETAPRGPGVIELPQADVTCFQGWWYGGVL